MSRSVKISGVVITYNEEQNIERCLKSLLSVCHEIIVVDSFSTDQTEEICKKYDVKFIKHKFDGHVQQKNFALAQTCNDIVLSLDADEALSPALEKSILEVKADCTAQAYKFNRYTNYCGKWIKHCGWYPDTKIRLWNKTYGQWGGTNPHDSVILTPHVSIQHLKGDLLHYSYYTIEEHVLRSGKYAKIAAKALYENNKKASIIRVISSAAFRFFKDYCLRLGFLDGFYGLIICGTNSHATFLKYTYLRSLNKGLPIE